MLAEWLSGARDLTAEAYAASEREVLADGRYGSTSEERAKRLRLVQRSMQAATWVGLGVFFWALAYPHPYRWVIAAAALLPWSALMIVKLSGGLVAWSSGAANPRPSATWLAYSGASALALRAFLDIDLIDLWPLVAASCVVACLAAAILFGRDERGRGERGATVTLAALVLSLYTYGAAAQLDVILDKSKADIVRLTVKAKSSTSGRNPTYEFQVGPWGDRAAGSLSVDHTLYEAVSVGSSVCVYRHAGGLGARWFVVDHCADDAPSS